MSDHEDHLHRSPFFLALFAALEGHDHKAAASLITRQFQKQEKRMDALTKALADLQAAVTALQGRAGTTVDVSALQPITDGLNAVTATVNTILPAPAQAPAPAQ